MEEITCRYAKAKSSKNGIYYTLYLG